MASRRKRGPVAFRPRLWTGLALSVVLKNIVHLRSYASVGNDRFVILYRFHGHLILAQ